MRPALSVILLTTLIGVGQGLFIALFAIESGVLPGVGADPDHGFRFLAGLVSVAFLGAGLLASFFHLGHPERAWRAAAMWRTSWLSREVIVLPLTMALIFAWAVLHGLAARSAAEAYPAGADLHYWIAALALMAVVALFLCTGMIYACVRFVEEWATALTVVNFTLLGAASGTTLAAAMAAFRPLPELATTLVAAALATTAIAAAGRGLSMRRNRMRRHCSSLQSAIGVRHSRIEQRAQGFTGGSFNTREFFHGASEGKLAWIRRGFVTLAFAGPLVLLAAAMASDRTWLALPAFALQLPGLMLERWYFFAEARHPQNLYYRTVS
jgi:DMSO reductase anchor subunit